MKFLYVILATLASMLLVNLIIDNLSSIESIEEDSRRLWVRNNRIGDYFRRLFGRPMVVTLQSDDLEVGT